MADVTNYDAALTAIELEYTGRLATRLWVALRLLNHSDASLRCSPCA
jgi:hypothetical protein